jgi:hypothetical protein
MVPIVMFNELKCELIVRLVDIDGIDHLHTPDLILKLCVFDIFLFELYALWRTKRFPFHAKEMERTNNLSIIFFKFIDI